MARNKNEVIFHGTEPARALALTVLAMVREINPKEHKAPRGHVADLHEELSDSLACANCGADVPSPRLFCSTFCAEFGGAVRYLRRAISDGRIGAADVQEGIGAKLLSFTAGGYPAERRALTRAQKDAILERDHQTCQICRGPASQVDHIAGNSNEPNNLRAICRNCNIGLAFSNARTVSAIDEPLAYDRISRIFEELAYRVAVTYNVRLCDDPVRWDTMRHSILRERKARFDELLSIAEGDDGWEDVDGYLYAAMQKDD